MSYENVSEEDFAHTDFDIHYEVEQMNEFVCMRLWEHQNIIQVS